MKFLSFILILWYLVADLIPSAVILYTSLISLNRLSSRNTVH